MHCTSIDKIGLQIETQSMTQSSASPTSLLDKLRLTSYSLTYLGSDNNALVPMHPQNDFISDLFSLFASELDPSAPP